MKITAESKCIRFLLAALVITLVFFLMSICSSAASDRYTVPAKGYESKDESARYAASPENSVSVFSYGKSSIGTFNLSGPVNKESTINGYAAFAATDSLTLGYSYDGDYQTGEKESWNLYSDSGKSVMDISLRQKVGNGVFIVQKSTDQTNWENAFAVVNLFSDKNVNRENLYTITDSELRQGTYYRVTIAYELRIKTGETTGSWWPPELPSDIFTQVFCVEVYEFYACYGSSQISLRNLSSGESLSDGSVVQDGFIIDPNDSANQVAVKCNTGPFIQVNSQTTFTESGKYTITVSTPLYQVFTYFIEVSGGLKTSALFPVVYQNKKNDEYTITNRVDGNAAFGAVSHTSLTIGQNSSTSIVKASHNGFDAFGIAGSNVSIYMKLQEDTYSSEGWEIVTDTWGKKDSQTIDGVHVGQVNSGALLIQTSSDGTNWCNVDKGRYASGLYSTDYEAYFQGKGEVLIYTPDGTDVLNGVYVRILYAYEIKNSSSKEDYRIIEEYKFYLCNSELDAVTFHNLSIEQDLETILSEYDETVVDVYQRAETMLSGGYTVTGFQIDTSLNPTVSYTIARNGAMYQLPATSVVSATGKYVIHLTSAVNTTKDVVLFVDRMRTDAALKYYFGDSFISGKRIYSDNRYAVYEGGLTSYQILAVDENHLPLGGHITNMSSGETIDISSTRDGKSGTLTAPGFYEAVLSTNPSFETAESSGDCRTFVFHFTIIEEGTAPGPLVNQNSLKSFIGTNISDAYPKYYGLTYPSATKGDITLAFASREAAISYAVKFEEGLVEPQSDGSFRYKGPFTIAGQKVKYESSWDVQDAVKYFAAQAVEVCAFDLSETFTVTTLEDEILEATENYRQLELNSSIVVFGDGQESQFFTPIAEHALPIISPKPYSYLTPGKDGTTYSGYNDFEFIRDKYGCDSDSVVILDAEGNVYPIRYGEGVGRQLEALGCPSGVVTICESTVYNDTAEYQAVFIAEGDNTARITLAYYLDGEEKYCTLAQDLPNESIIAEAFSIEEIKDELDPYCLVIVKQGADKYYCVADETPRDAWSNPGRYTIKVVNRLGYSYVFSVDVVESDLATISFAGEGTEAVGYILSRFGEQNVQLPDVSRYGYTLVGFVDENGILYKNEIPTLPYRGSVTLNAVWEAKQYQLTLQDGSGSDISTMAIDFGKPYQLPVPALDEGYAFEGWLLDGVLLDDEIFTLKTESNITLVARTTYTEHATESSSEEANTKRSSSIWFVIVIAVAVLIVGFLASIIKKRKNSHISGNNEPIAEEDEEDDTQ